MRVLSNLRISACRLEEFSVKDLLAFIFTIGFWIVVFRDKVEMVSALVPLLAIVLGGYFGTEAFVWYQQRRFSGGPSVPPTSPPSPVSNPNYRGEPQI